MTKDELIAWRKNLGLTQKEAAAVLPVNPRTYEGWESGRTIPDFLPRALADAAKEIERKKAK